MPRLMRVAAIVAVVLTLVGCEEPLFRIPIEYRDQAVDGGSMKLLHLNVFDSPAFQPQDAARKFCASHGIPSQNVAMLVKAIEEKLGAFRRTQPKPAQSQPVLAPSPAPQAQASPLLSAPTQQPVQTHRSPRSAPHRDPSLAAQASARQHRQQPDIKVAFNFDADARHDRLLVVRPNDDVLAEAQRFVRRHAGVGLGTAFERYLVGEIVAQVESQQIGRAACRGRVEIPVVAASVKKNI